MPLRHLHPQFSSSQCLQPLRRPDRRGFRRPSAAGEMGRFGGRFRVGSGSFWDRFGVALGSVWGRFRGDFFDPRQPHGNHNRIPNRRLSQTPRNRPPQKRSFPTRSDVPLIPFGSRRRQSDQQKLPSIVPRHTASQYHAPLRAFVSSCLIFFAFGHAMPGSLPSLPELLTTDH